MKKKNKSKRFLPEFRPTRVEVIAGREEARRGEGPMIFLQIDDIQYDAGFMRIFVRKP